MGQCASKHSARGPSGERFSSIHDDSTVKDTRTKSNAQASRDWKNRLKQMYVCKSIGKNETVDKEVDGVKEGADDAVMVPAMPARGNGRKSTAAVSWEELPTAALALALEWLSFVEGRHFFLCNHALWDIKRIEYESEFIHELVLPGTPPCSFLDSLANVECLDFGPFHTDELLKHMRDERVLPKLKHLGMARSLQVTDAGLKDLAKNSVRCRTLASLDITFCHCTTYGVILVLRNKLIALFLIRRQPDWMDGKFVFPNGMCLIQWPDGSFLQMNGEMRYCGYLCGLFALNSENNVICKRQFAYSQVFDNTFWQSQPEWARYAYRRAEALLHHPKEGTYLKAYPRKGLFPIPGFPCRQHASSIGIGRGRYFNGQGERCNRNDPNCKLHVAHLQSGPLEEFMPSPEIMEMFRAHMKDMARVMAGRDQERDEREVHLLLGGQSSDVPPPQWFQYY